MTKERRDIKSDIKEYCKQCAGMKYKHHGENCDSFIANHLILGSGNTINTGCPLSAKDNTISELKMAIENHCNLCMHGIEKDNCQSEECSLHYHYCRKIGF